MVRYHAVKGNLTLAFSRFLCHWINLLLNWKSQNIFFHSCRLFTVSKLKALLSDFIKVEYTDCEEAHFYLVSSLRRNSHQIPQFYFILSWEKQQWPRHRDSYSILILLSCVAPVLCSSCSIHSCSATKLNRPNWNYLEQFRCVVLRESVKAIQNQKS